MGDSDNLSKIFTGRANPSQQYMLGKLFDYHQRLKLLASGKMPSYCSKETVEACNAYIEAMEQTINAPGRFWKKKAFSGHHPGCHLFTIRSTR
jgi:hypothetical protein